MVNSLVNLNYSYRDQAQSVLSKIRSKAKGLFKDKVGTDNDKDSIKIIYLADQSEITFHLSTDTHINVRAHSTKLSDARRLCNALERDKVIFENHEKTSQPKPQKEHEHAFDVLKRNMENAEFAEHILVLPSALDEAKECEFKYAGTLDSNLKKLVKFSKLKRDPKHAKMPDEHIAKQLAGLGHFSHAISQTAKINFPEDYTAEYKGKKQLFEMHITLGSGGNARTCMSIYMDWIQQFKNSSLDVSAATAAAPTINNLSKIMANNHISNAVLPPEERVVNDYHEADIRLNSLINYLNDCIQSVQKRKAYVVPAGKWSLKPYNDNRKQNRGAGGKLIIERNFYSTMGPAKTEQLDEDFSWKASSRPNINSELGWAFNLEGSDPRSTRMSKRTEIELNEENLVKMRKDKNLKRNFHRLNISVIGEGVFELSEEDFDYLKSHVGKKSIWFEQSVQVLLRKKEFADMLLNRPARQHEPLKQILEPDYVFEPSPHVPIAENQWIDLKDPSIMGTEQQREFVEKALNGKDLTIVWGPAGSGKTTAICEFIKQAVRNNKKVLMVGSTHIAVDNVLEKFARSEATPLRDDEPGVIAVRVGRPAKVSEYVRPLLIENFIRTKRQALQKHLKPIAGSKKAEAAAAIRMLECVDNEQAGGIMQAVLMGANLVCGTTIGILQHPEVKLARETGSYPNFDYLILDEASKTTLDEFLVPAMCAKRWIIVGDPYQLAPFCEEAELGASLLTAIMSRTPKNSDPTNEIIFADPGSPKVRKQLQDAIKISLEARSVRFQNDDFTKQILDRKKTALEYLSGYYILNQNKEAVTLLENTDLAMAIALPSILESLIGEAEGLPAAGSIVRPLKEGLDSRMVKLKYQHRMPRHIADFAKNYVYKGRMLITPENAKEKPRLHSQENDPEGRLVVLTPENPQECVTDYINGERESAEQLVLAVKELLDFARWAKLNPKKGGEGNWIAYLISTYKNQNRLCLKLVDYLYEAHGDIFDSVDIEANTVDSCQGHEADLILLTLVRDRQTPFMRSLNRMNVAFTRAKSRMVILGDLPEKTEEAQNTGKDCTMLDALNDYHVTRTETKHLKEAQSIVNKALKNLN